MSMEQYSPASSLQIDLPDHYIIKYLKKKRLTQLHPPPSFFTHHRRTCLLARLLARLFIPSLKNWKDTSATKATHPGAHVSVSGRHFIPHVIPVVLAGLPRHVTAPGVGPWATAHRVPIIVHSICSKHDDTLTTSSGSSLKQFKG